MFKMKYLKFEMTLSFLLIVIIIITTAELINFWWIKDVIETRVSETTVETLKQIDKNMDSLFGNVEDISKYTLSNNEVRSLLKLTDRNSQEATELLIKLNEEYANLTNSKSFIAAINIYGKNKLKFESAGASTTNDKKFVKGEELLGTSERLYAVSPTYKRSYYTLGDQYIISVYRQIKDINNLNRLLGFIRIDISEKIINEIYKEASVGKTGYIFIADKEGLIISHSDKKLIGSSIKKEGFSSAILKQRDGYYKEKINGKNLLITYYQSDKHNMIYLGSVPYNELMDNVDKARNLTIIITLVAIIAAFIFSYILSMQISVPISVLTDSMQQVEKGDFDVKIEIKREDEIGQLSESFNHMVCRLKSLIEENYLIKIKRKEAELEALQAQINPHFLYNTLDIAYWSSRMEKAPNTEGIIKNLAKVFKLGLNKGNEITTISKELEHLESYLFIQLLRYEEEPLIQFDIDETIKENKIIKLLLQPIVENALQHGIVDMESGGCINIKGYRDKEDIVFEVSDNGKGIENSRIYSMLSEKPNRIGYGLKNIDERIQLYYGEKYGIVIESHLNKGTKVTIRIPKYQEDVNGND